MFQSTQKEDFMTSSFVRSSATPQQHSRKSSFDFPQNATHHWVELVFSLRKTCGLAELLLLSHRHFVMLVGRVFPPKHATGISDLFDIMTLTK
ncbi:unnamed protein product [Periconia digitata]|uniref:Uncharacterized protein n=1 Tax=Periconia digitata TaxID=1303443 RepID=A0A9W4UK01_9PLEO|nr:unnamed protein product [Periconia digitata]